MVKKQSSPPVSTLAASSLKAATDILKGLNAANTLATVNEVKISLQEKIFDAREALSAAQDSEAVSLQRIDGLEKEIVRLKNWEAEKQHYELKAVDSGAFVYIKKPGMEAGQPAHWLCANCYQNGRPSILQGHGRAATTGFDSRLEVWGCPHCKSTVRLPGRAWPSALSRI